MLITHGMFGLGALAGPSLVYIFEDKVFAVLGVAAILIAPFYFRIKSP